MMNDLSSLLSSAGKKCEFHVSELYSPPRLTPSVGKAGLKMGSSFDKEHMDEIHGKSFDLNKRSDLNEAKRFRRERPSALWTLSPPCTKMSQIQSLNEPVSVEDWNEAVYHVDNSVEFAENQMKDNLYFAF